MKKAIILLALMVVMAGVGWGMGTVPPLMNFQGRLLDGGNPIARDKSVTFRIYDNENIGSGSPVGSPAWSETYTVAEMGIDAQGIVNVNLGNRTALDPNLLAYAGNYYLDIEVAGQKLGIDSNGDGVPDKRQRLVSVPFAFNAQNVINGGSGTNYIIAKNKNTSILVNAIEGDSFYGTGVQGTSTREVGVKGRIPPTGKSGVMGMTSDAISPADTNVGVLGVSNYGSGVVGRSVNNNGIYGKSDTGKGIYGEAGSTGYGVYGICNGTSGIGVYGAGSAKGIEGYSYSGIGLVGSTSTATGCAATSNTGTGISAVSGSTVMGGKPAIYAENTAPGTTIGTALQIGRGRIKIASTGSIYTGDNPESYAPAGIATFAGSNLELFVFDHLVNADSIILLTKQEGAGDQAYYWIKSRAPGSGFTIGRNIGEGSTRVGYLIIN